MPTKKKVSFKTKKGKNVSFFSKVKKELGPEAGPLAVLGSAGGFTILGPPGAAIGAGIGALAGRRIHKEFREAQRKKPRRKKKRRS